MKATLIKLWGGILSVLAMGCLVFALAVQFIPQARAGPEAALDSQQMSGQDRRLSALEAITAEHRLTVLETSLEDIRWELRLVLGALAGLLVDAAVRLTRRAKA